MDDTRGGDAGRQLARWSAEPGSGEIFRLALLTAPIFVAFIAVFQNYLAKVDNFGDSMAYMRIANAIRHWNFQGVAVEHFWGLPYGMALLSMITRVSDRTALLALSLAGSLVSVLLAQRLWGGWVAGFFAVLNFDWLQRSYLGGSEPLFAAFLFGSFLALRRGRPLLAALLAALATVVRPLGIFALLGIGLSLLWKRRLKEFALATTIGVTVGILYTLPLVHFFGSAFANVHGYSPTGNILGVPFYAIIKGTILYPSPWTNLVVTFGWILFVLAGMVAMVASETCRAYGREFPAEAVFGWLYLISVFCYNYPYWARGNFPRFVIPAIPFVLLALQRWIPKDRRLLWTLAVVSPVLAAASAIGIQNVAAALRR